jgi:Tol biopolymer transport system component
MGWGLDPKTKQRVFISETVRDISSGGAYGWWGTGYAFSPEGTRLAYARTDSIGVIDLASRASTDLTQFVAYNSHSDWAWYPQLRWSPDGLFIYGVTHGLPYGFEAPEDSTVFNLSALAAGTGQKFDLVPRAGMYANPVPSTTRLAFLQADEPDNSPLSRYRLAVIDKDGSNLRVLFPPDDLPGLSAAETTLAWSPDARRIAAIYNGNLWLVDPDTGVSQQITGDGQTVRVAWGK